MVTGIQLSNGEYFDFWNPEKSKWGIGVIAHALARLCRYTGHCRKFYERRRDL